VGKINWGRMIVGGLVAGLLMNAGEFVLNQLILKTQWDAVMNALHLPPPGSGAMAWFIVGGFLGGTLTLWLYAAIRPRFGPGPKTAALAGFFVWTLACFLAMMPPMVTGVLPPQVAWTAILWELVEVPLAAVVGAWFYQEA
jgi:hypothetical protein